ncbi:probable NADH dehydrogenase [ubiquinone] 1 alpha subcomplex subunit 12 [Hyposmocoma kahamanoa]|uniref:probable NADH dehydrogenase [ubiquinone] 1 alpha subcomplex subunit 12 n=1 Tax=Hyposmocoma kahamanoa TaxID=1477025 RepID=UPI000E6D8CCD|nr:probable NADH dehydrogenase [ubiquinone] 1 alpha subcomplex subunit 12 [Hyposmocoma kahamanoa]
MSLIALEKWKRVFRIIKQHGGPIKSLSKLWRTDTLKEGKLVGRDLHGNRYYENDYYLLGRNRWVEFNDKVKFEYDASQIHPEWYGWLHYVTDCLPCEDSAKMDIACCGWYTCWLLPYEENWSGSVKTFQPYSTTPTRIQCWNGGCAGDKLGYGSDSLVGPCPSS